MLINESYEFKPKFTRMIMVYFGYALLMGMGYLHSFFNFLFTLKWLSPKENRAPLIKSFEHFYRRHLYRRTSDCFNRPICSAPGTKITVMQRASKDSGSTYTLTGKTNVALNLGSYNYLGFAGKNSTNCTAESINRLYDSGVSSCTFNMSSTISNINRELETRVADFIGHEDAFVVAQGFATNQAIIPALVGPGCLIMSDELNHSSLVAGCKRSGAKVAKFKHNDVDDLRKNLDRYLLDGNNGELWKKILVLVEGIYSMEGEIAPIREILLLKYRYKFYLYIDEAHSIGALGATGRGVCEYWGVDPREVDVLMGTFTKSFGSVGGYIAGSKSLIAHLKRYSEAALCTSLMSPACAQQAISVIDCLMGKHGSREGEYRLQRLSKNTRYFRRKLRTLGLEALGDLDSPVIPILLYHPAKIPAFSRETLKRGLAVVVVGFPATQILLSRVRFCVSAAHTKEDLDRALKIIKEVSELCAIKYLSKPYRLLAEHMLREDTQIVEDW
ncbi:hypothetical protein RCL1_004323 [Eukaryota sp. TZLM3-RCL]